MSRLARSSSSPWSNSLTELPPSAACISSSLSPGEEENCLIQSSRELHARAALSSHARKCPAVWRTTTVLPLIRHCCPGTDWHSEVLRQNLSLRESGGGNSSARLRNVSFLLHEGFVLPCSYPSFSDFTGKASRSRVPFPSSLPYA